MNESWCKCNHCGYIHDGICPRIKSIEYEHGMIKKIEYHGPHQEAAKISKLLLEQKFMFLANKWKAETRHVSNITTKSMNKAYLQIISMGYAAVPLILNDLIKNGPDHWFFALNIITDENLIPFPEGSAGDMEVMKEAWIRWGRLSGYLS